MNICFYFLDAISARGDLEYPPINIWVGGGIDSKSTSLKNLILSTFDQLSNPENEMKQQEEDSSSHPSFGFSSRLGPTHSQVSC